MRISRQVLTAAVALALTVSSAKHAGAEDIDLFVGAAASAANPNVLIILDNSANWSSANQHWSGGYKQGESELRALRTLAGELNDKVNFGLMMLTPGGGSGYDDGGYVRFHLRPMTPTNIAGFQQMIGPDTGCIDGVNTLTGGANCIYKNFQGGEQVGTDKVDYSAALYEAFKYFGGYTSPANAHNDTAGSPTGKEAFGRFRYAGPIPTSDSKYDRGAFVDPTSGKTEYSNWNSISCAKNYVILIGNGFPNTEPSEIADILTRVGGSISQLPMPTFTTTTSTTTDNLGINTACRKVSDCVADATALFPAGTYESYSCTGGTLCAGQAGKPNAQYQNQTMLGNHTIYTVTPTGLSALPGSEARYADEWAKFLYTTDVSDQPGQQNVKVFTIDVFKDQQDQNQTALLSSMAKYGGGKYYQASSEQAILNALREILIDIQSVNSVFAAASLPINAASRTQSENQVFIGMFRPDPSAKPRWYGNVKRYKIGRVGSNLSLVDAVGQDAVSTETGFIHPCARSFWTTDSGTYWTFSQISAGQCTIATTSVFSDSPDGPLVEKGGTAQVVRNGNAPPGTDTTPTNTVNRALYTCLFPGHMDYCTLGANGSLTPFNDAIDVNGDYLNVWLGGLIPWWDGATLTDAEHVRIINFTRGVDTEDDNQVNSNTDTRPSLHGDVAHSRPLPVNYGGSTGVVLYYGANDGTFRAISGDNGNELWAFIAPEHHPRLRRLQRNEPIILYPNMTAPLPTPTPVRKDYFFDGTAGLFQNADNSKIWVFPTMRRGGNMLQAFDVTNPTIPSLKWRQGCFKVPYTSSTYDPATAADVRQLIINNGYVETADGYFCSPGFENIGQTWSTPAAALVKGFGTDKNQPVLIVGGGYDACDDVDAKTSTCSAPRGSNVYVIKAATGEIVKKFGTGGTGTIERSVPSDITLIDRDFDGYVDHGYFVDTGGALYRIDFVDPSTLAPLPPDSWKLTKLAFTTGGGRKFLFAPAALLSAGKVYLTVGSGDRERPLITNYPYMESVLNRAYMFIDTFEVPVAPATTVTPVDLDGALMDNFTTDLGCSANLSTNSRGWFFDLNVARGEQVVTSTLIVGGLVYFSTNHPEEPKPGVCRTELGEARPYAVNLLNASGAIGAGALCGGDRSSVFPTGGLPQSPALAPAVPLDGQNVTVMTGVADLSGAGQDSPLKPNPYQPPITQRRSRIYWYQHGDQ